MSKFTCESNEKIRSIEQAWYSEIITINKCRQTQFSWNRFPFSLFNCQIWQIYAKYILKSADKNNRLKNKARIAPHIHVNSFFFLVLLVTFTCAPADKGGCSGAPGPLGVAAAPYDVIYETSAVFLHVINSCSLSMTLLQPWEAAEGSITPSALTQICAFKILKRKKKKKRQAKRASVVLWRFACA